MTEELVTISIRNSFAKFGKDISHLTEEEVREKSKLAIIRTEELGIDVNQNEAFLNVMYEVFEV